MSGFFLTLQKKAKNNRIDKCPVFLSTIKKIEIGIIETGKLQQFLKTFEYITPPSNQGGGCLVPVLIRFGDFFTKKSISQLPSVARGP